MKKSLIIIIGLGILNVMHAGLHLIQFVQSVILFKTSLEEETHSTLLEKIIHSPYLAIVWCIIGLFTLYVGIRDFHHHHHHKD